MVRAAVSSSAWLELLIAVVQRLACNKHVTRGNPSAVHAAVGFITKLVLGIVGRRKSDFRSQRISAESKIRNCGFSRCAAAASGTDVLMSRPVTSAAAVAGGCGRYNCEESDAHHSSNENKISYGYRERAEAAMEVN